MPRNGTMAHVAAIDDVHAKDFTTHGRDFGFRAFVKDDNVLAVAVEGDKRTR